MTLSEVRDVRLIPLGIGDPRHLIERRLIDKRRRGGDRLLGAGQQIALRVVDHRRDGTAGARDLRGVPLWIPLNQRSPIQGIDLLRHPPERIGLKRGGLPLGIFERRLNHRRLLDRGRIIGDHRPGYRFTATWTFGRLLTGTSVINAGGGGEGS